MALGILLIVVAGSALVLPALRHRRTAFVAFVAMSLVSFPMRAGWPAVPLAPQGCELLVSLGLAFYSLRNVPHIVLFAVCFPLARAQFRGAHADILALLTTIAVGALVELAEGVAGQGHCRLRDLLPDTAGALLGWAGWHTTRYAWRRFGPRPEASA